LKKKDELDNTIIIWTADHGSHLGDHNLIHKGTHYDRSARVPFVVWWGKNIEPGVRNGFSSHVDLMSTLIDLAGGQPPLSQEGHTLRKMISGESEGDDHAIVEIFENYSLLTQDYIYGVFPNSKEKVLIDRRKDPNAHNNLISDKDYSKTAERLQNVLYDFRPEIEEEFQSGTPLPDLPNAIGIEQGKTSSKEGPYLGGQTLKITGSFTHSKGQEGPLVVFHEGDTHGLSIYIKQDKLYCGIRTWYDDQIEPINSQYLIGKNKFELKLESSGRVSVVLNGSPVTEFQSSWPMPVQPGKKQYLTGTWSIGKTESRWFKPIGNYEKENTYPGIINPVQVQTLN